MAEEVCGRAVLVTGAESGIGLAIARTCREAGARVVHVDLEDRGCSEEATGSGEAIFVQADVTQPAAIEKAFAVAQDSFGPLSAVIANAGRMIRPVPIQELTHEDWNQALAVNLTGTFLTLHAAARHMIAGGIKGQLLATGSSLAFRPQPATHAYVVAKAGVHALVKSMALELAPHGIRVNAIAPGVTRTPATEVIPGYLNAAAANMPLGSVAEPEEVAALALLLLSEKVPHMTGSVLSLDSGYTI
jgi:NAD(P)-dependent dehydrogenase (short-subunit alcohol dehydrogenase family)